MAIDALDQLPMPLRYVTAAPWEVRLMTAGDRASFLLAWHDYCAAEGIRSADTEPSSLFQRLLDPGTGQGCLVVAANNGAPIVAFVTFCLHHHTFSSRQICYVEDLYVAPPARRQGMGKALMIALEQTGRRLGWGRLYWHTDTTNTAAQALYDSMATRQTVVTYELSLDAIDEGMARPVVIAKAG